MHHPATATEYKERLFIHAFYIVEIKTKTTLGAPLCPYAAWCRNRPSIPSNLAVSKAHFRLDVIELSTCPRSLRLAFHWVSPCRTNISFFRADVPVRVRKYPSEFRAENSRLGCREKIWGPVSRQSQVTAPPGHHYASGNRAGICKLHRDGAWHPLMRWMSAGQAAILRRRSR